MILCCRIVLASTIQTDTLGAFTGTQDWSRMAGSNAAPAGAVIARFYLSTDGDPNSLCTSWYD